MKLDACNIISLSVVKYTDKFHYHKWQSNPQGACEIYWLLEGQLIGKGKLSSFNNKNS